MDKEVFRPVSVLEANARSFGIVVSRNIIKGAFPVSAFRRALEIIAARHPFLNAAFCDCEKGSLFYKKGLPPPLSIREEIRSESQRDLLYEEELNRRMDARERLWSILLVLDGKESELGPCSLTEMILSVQHSICDGVSILNLAKEILEQTRAVNRRKPLYEDRQLPVLPPFDEYLIDIIRESAPDHQTRIEADRQDFLSTPLDMPDRDLSVPKSECRIKSIHGGFHDADLTRIWRHSAAQKISIHGILAACILKAMGNQIREPADRNYNILMRNPVDRRKQVHPPLGSTPLQMFTASELIIGSFSRSDAVTELARAFSKKLCGDIEMHKALRKYKSAVEFMHPEEINKEKNYQLITFSNAGRVDTPSDYGAFELLSTNFVSSHRHLAIQFSMTTFQNHMFYVINYTHPWYKTELMENFHHSFRENFLKYISE